MSKKRANEFTGSQWVKNSISVWNDINKNIDEKKLKHPAMFPEQLVRRLINCFTNNNMKVILDPFLGSGTTLVAARNTNKEAIGFEINPKYIELSKARLAQISLFDTPTYKIFNTSAINILEHIEENSVDFCVTSPPYWDILNAKRTADNKEIRHYGNLENDLGIIKDYNNFISELGNIFEKVYKVLKKDSYCIVIVMDIRKGSKFYPYHIDLSNALQNKGFIFDDIVIWDRRLEYNNLRALGYPSVFRINKIHEYIMIFKK